MTITISMATGEPAIGLQGVVRYFLNITPAKYASGDINPNIGEQYDSTIHTNTDNEMAQFILRKLQARCMV